MPTEEHQNQHQHPRKDRRTRTDGSKSSRKRSGRANSVLSLAHLTAFTSERETNLIKPASDECKLPPCSHTSPVSDLDTDSSSRSCSPSPSHFVSSYSSASSPPFSSLYPISTSSASQIQTHMRERSRSPSRPRPHATRQFHMPTAANSPGSDSYKHSNCRYLLDRFNWPEYAKFQEDPDIPIPWDYVDQVIFSAPTTATVTCPICLCSPPTAPRITKCGHIYCLTCLVELFARPSATAAASATPTACEPSMERRNLWRICPVCGEAINVNDMRSVRLWMHLPTNRDALLDFDWLPAPQGAPQQLASCQDIASLMRDRLLLSTTEYILDEIITPEIKTLMAHVCDEDRDCVDGAPQLRAELILTRKCRLKCTRMMDHTAQCFVTDEQFSAATTRHPNIPTLERKLQPIDANDKVYTLLAIARLCAYFEYTVARDADGPRIEKRAQNKCGACHSFLPRSKTVTAASCCGVFQSCDGRLCFVHPFLTSILVSVYGEENMGLLYPTLSTHVLRFIAAFSSRRPQDAETEPSLTHLPHGTPVELADIDLEPIVGHETYELYRSQIDAWRAGIS